MTVRRDFVILTYCGSSSILNHSDLITLSFVAFSTLKLRALHLHASDGPTAGTDLPSWNGSIQTCTCKPGGGGGGNKFFRGGGPYILEKFVPGGTNLKGVQIKRDRHYTSLNLAHGFVNVL